MALSDIVSVTIRLATSSITRAGFGTLNIVGTTQRVTNRINEYSDMDAVDDDYHDTDPEYLAANAFFSQSPSPTVVKISRWDSTAETLPVAMAAITTEDDDWYGLMLTNRVLANQQALAVWAESRTTIAGIASDDANIINLTAAADTATSIAGILHAASYIRSWVLYSAQADGTANDTYPDAAWFGKMLTYDLDVETATWALKTPLTGITADVLTSTQRTNILAKDANMYHAFGGTPITWEGTVAGNEYIDIITGRDWLQIRMQEDIFQALVSNPKLPYTNKGIAAIGGIIRKRMKVGQSTEYLAIDSALGPLGYSLTVPDVSDVSGADKAARLLRKTKFRATVAGAIHTVQITGTLSA